MPNFLTVKEFKGGGGGTKKLGVSFDGQDAPPTEQKGEITLIPFKFTGLSDCFLHAHFFLAHFFLPVFTCTFLSSSSEELSVNSRSYLAREESADATCAPHWRGPAVLKDNPEDPQTMCAVRGDNTTSSSVTTELDFTRNVFLSRLFASTITWFCLVEGTHLFRQRSQPIIEV